MSLKLLFVRLPRQHSNNLRSLQIRNYQLKLLVARYSIEAGEEQRRPSESISREPPDDTLSLLLFKSHLPSQYLLSSIAFQIKLWWLHVHWIRIFVFQPVPRKQPRQPLIMLDVVVDTIIQLTIDFLAWGTQSFRGLFFVLGCHL